MSIRILLVVIAVLLGVITAMVAVLLAKGQGAHPARALRDAGMGFVSTVTVTVFLMKWLQDT